MRRPWISGIAATVTLLAVYVAIVSLVSGWSNFLRQFQTFWYYVIPLAVGFGVQVGLFTYLKRVLRARAVPTAVVATTGTTSTVAMVACCSHYIVNVLPFLGGVGAVTLLAQYQVEFFWVGIVANLLGIAYLLGKVRRAINHAL